MTHTPLLLTALLTLALPAAAQEKNGKWVHTHESEIWLSGLAGQSTLETDVHYDALGRTSCRYERGWEVQDSLVYRYNDHDQLIYKADYRGTSPANLTFYTYDEWDYDEYIPTLAVIHLGHQNVDKEWSLYIAEKLGITRDENHRIVRLGDYTPGEGDMPDVPISYVKSFAYDDALTTYVKESYGFDPVTEEAFLKTDELWSDIRWENYAGNVLDPNDCFKGENRIKSAHVYDDYYGYEYDLTALYGTATGRDDARPADFLVTMDIPSIGQRKIHSLTLTDDNGSFVEEFRTYRIDAAGNATLSFVDRVTETYDDHGNLTLQERALTDDLDNPERVSVRKGDRFEYEYDATYGDWTQRTALQYYQSYEEGVDGTYEPKSRIVRTKWEFLPAAGISAPTASAAPAPVFNLHGQRLAAPARGISIEGGRKVVRR